MHGLKTIHQLNREAAEAREICEKHGVALGDIPAAPAELPAPKRVADLTDDELLGALGYGLPDGGRYSLYDRPNVDESAK